MGWNISGIPAIARIRGDAGMTFTASDSYSYLPGGWGSSAGADNLLVAKSADRYHLARNIAGIPFMEFQAAGSGCGGGPCYFIGRDGQGNTYYFGGDEQHLATRGLDRLRSLGARQRRHPGKGNRGMVPLPSGRRRRQLLLDRLC
jgi:hypothetical protein